ncbi:MAG: pentapeptide repeat-containing protein, partial [bacterium]
AEAAAAEGSTETQADDAAEPSECAVEGAWRGYPPVAEAEGTTAQPERTDLDAQTLRLEAGGRMFLEHANFEQANLFHTNLTGAIVTNGRYIIPELRAAKLCYSILPNVRRSFRDCGTMDVR